MITTNHREDTVNKQTAGATSCYRNTNESRSSNYRPRRVSPRAGTDPSHWLLIQQTGSPGASEQPINSTVSSNHQINRATDRTVFSSIGAHAQIRAARSETTDYQAKHHVHMCHTQASRAKSYCMLCNINQSGVRTTRFVGLYSIDACSHTTANSYGEASLPTRFGRVCQG